VEWAGLETCGDVLFSLFLYCNYVVVQSFFALAINKEEKVTSHWFIVS